MSVSKRLRVWIPTTVVVVVAAGAWPVHHYWWIPRQIESFHADCRAATVSKDWPQLEEAARNWLSWDGTSGDAWWYLGIAAQEQGDLDLAADCLGKLPDDHPKCVEALRGSINLLAKQLNRPLDAERNAQRLLKIEPRAGRAYTFLIFYYAMTLDRQRLVKTVRKAVKFGAEPAGAYTYLFMANSLRFRNGYDLNTRWRKKHPDNEGFEVAQAFFSATSPSGTKLFGGDRSLDDRRGLMKKCLGKYPANVEVLAFYLDQNVTQGNRENVARLLSRAPRSAEGDSRFFAAKGWYHGIQGEFEKSEAAYRLALQNDPYNWRVQHELSGILRRQGKLSGAKVLAKLAQVGKKLEHDLLELPKAEAITGELLKQLADYARDVGDQPISRGIRRRLGR